MAAAILVAAGCGLAGCVGAGIGTPASPASAGSLATAPAEPAAAPAAAETPAPAEPPPPSAAFELPDTPVGRAARDWLDLFNRGDETEVQTFLLERFTPDFTGELPVPALVAFHLQSLERYGSVTPVAVLEDEPYRVLLLAHSAAGETLELTLELEDAEPHRISALRLVQADWLRDGRSPGR